MINIMDVFMYLCKFVYIYSTNIVSSYHVNKNEFKIATVYITILLCLMVIIIIICIGLHIVLIKSKTQLFFLNRKCVNLFIFYPQQPYKSLIK